MMVVIFVVLVYGLAIAFCTAILAASLFLVEDAQTSSFKEFGVMGTLGRCAGIVLTTTLVSLIPFGGLLALIIWFLGIMFLFQLPFLKTLILFIVNVLLN